MRISAEERMRALRELRETLDKQIAEAQSSVTVTEPPFQPGDQLMRMGMYVTVAQVAFCFNRWLFLCYYDNPRSECTRGKFFIFQADELKGRDDG